MINALIIIWMIAISAYLIFYFNIVLGMFKTIYDIEETHKETTSALKKEIYSLNENILPLIEKSDSIDEYRTVLLSVKDAAKKLNSYLEESKETL